ncbi:MAG TPA: MFS transporter [Streptosporangiaceae bacterium]|jgi:DHA2 family methylenomycin A resistance protein-like MFS transporter
MSVIGAARQRLGGPGRAGTLAAASLGFSVVQLDVFVVNVAVRQIGTALGAGTSGLQWVVGIYTLMFAALILTAGALGDRLGARRMFAAGFAVFMAASLACALAPGIGVLIGARAVQGAGAALLGACSLALINHAFTDDAGRGRAVAWWAAGASVALSAGPIIGGLLIAALDWRAVFLINLPIGTAGLWLTWRHVPETPTARHSFDLGGQATAIIALGALAWALIEGGAAGFASPAVLAAFALAAAGLAAFLVIEARRRDSMLPLGLFRRPAFAAPAFLGLLVNIAFYGLIFVFSLLWQEQDGYSALRTGLAFVPMTASVLVANLVTRRLAALIGTRPVILVGLAGMAAGCAGLLFAGPGTPFAAIVGQQVLLGGGIGLLVPPMTSTIMGSVERSRSGVASGTLSAMRQAGSVLGVAVFGSLIAAGRHFSTGFHIALVIALVVIAAGAALAPALSADSARPGPTPN